MKILYNIIRWLLLAACAGVILAMVLMVWTARDPGSVSGLLWTKEALELYESDPEYFRVTAYKGFEDRNYSQDSRFGYSRTVRIDDLGQWQVLIRYNDAVLRDLEESRGKTDFTEGERFVYTLEDEFGHIYTDYSYVWEKTSRHTFVRLAFDSVEESFSYEEADESGNVKTKVDRIGELKLSVYCREDVKDGEYPERPEAVMYIWGDGTGVYEYEKVKKDLPKDMEPTDGLCHSSSLTDKENEVE